MRLEKELPHHIVAENKDHGIGPMTKWCEEQFGERWSAIDRTDSDRNWTCFWCGNHMPAFYDFYFRHEADAIMFSLRWL
jgi:hypothetical protein